MDIDETRPVGFKQRVFARARSVRRKVPRVWTKVKAKADSFPLVLIAKVISFVIILSIIAYAIFVIKEEVDFGYKASLPDSGKGSLVEDLFGDYFANETASENDSNSVVSDISN